MTLFRYALSISAFTRVLRRAYGAGIPRSRIRHPSVATILFYEHLKT
jgi:hypothetical protein